MIVEHTAARALARIAHFGQVDKAGEPYFCHLLRVASQLDTFGEQTVAFLHDIIEDTPVSCKDLNDIGFSEQTIQSVALLTRDDKTEYYYYIRYIIETNQSTPIRVKIADLKDHLRDTSCLSDSMIQRYKKALKMLEKVGQ